MKKLTDYIVEAEQQASQPVAGDAFSFDIMENEAIVESYVLKSSNDRIVVAADQTAFELLESYEYQLSEIDDEDYDYFDDEDTPSDQGFFVILYNEDDEPFVGVVAKDGGKWREIGGTGAETPYNWGGTYMGYLDPEDVMTWIRRDYERHYQVLGPFFDEREAMDKAGLSEAEYQGRDVELNKPMAGDVKKFKVYVKDPKTGNVKKVNFGQKGMRIKKNNPERRKSFRARHNCDNPGPKTKARYWSCRKW